MILFQNKLLAVLDINAAAHSLLDAASAKVINRGVGDNGSFVRGGDDLLYAGFRAVEAEVKGLYTRARQFARFDVSAIGGNGCRARRGEEAYLARRG